MAAQKKWMTWTGWILSALIGLMMMAGVIAAIVKPEEASKGLVDFGYPKEVFVPLVVVEACCVILYLLPPTAVLGAVLLTGYLGGAVATHVRAHDGNYPAAIIVAVCVWLALFLRDPRIRALLPLRSGIPK